MIKGSTNLVGIIGRPVSHSLSPAMHNAVFKALGMDWAYVPMEVDPVRLGEAVKGLRALNFRGVNVTVPHKERVIDFIDNLSEQAKEIGAVNTIVMKSGSMVGHNTDWAGFLNHLTELEFDPSGSQSCVLGSGGSARAVAYALAKSGAETTICARNRANGESLVQYLAGLFPKSSIRYLSLERFEEQACDLLVNTTPVGMSKQSSESPIPENSDLSGCKLVYDIVYGEHKTALTARSEYIGIKAVNGLGMLVHQAALAFEIWTGIKPDIEIMKRAVNLC